MGCRTLRDLAGTSWRGSFGGSLVAGTLRDRAVVPFLGFSGGVFLLGVLLWGSSCMFARSVATCFIFVVLDVVQISCMLCGFLVVLSILLLVYL